MLTQSAWHEAGAIAAIRKELSGRRTVTTGFTSQGLPRDWVHEGEEDHRGERTVWAESGQRAQREREWKTVKRYVTLATLLMSLIFLCGLLSIFCFFGYLIATRVLRLQNTLVVTGMTWFAGEVFYTIVLNALGYVIPIHIAFWLVLALMFTIGVTALLLPKEPVTERPPRWVAVTLWIFAIMAGVAFARANASDSPSLIHYPIPATILEGNFPIHDPFNPWNGYGYHYAPMLFAAAVTALTGIDLAASYALQPFLHAITLVFFTAAIGYALTRSWKGSLLIALLACGGGGFSWLYGFPLLKDLVSIYVLHHPFEGDGQTPLRFVSYMFGAIRGQPLLNTLEHRAVGMGMAALMASLYTLYELIHASAFWKRISWLCFLVLSLSLLALSLETSFVLLFVVLAGLIVVHRVVSLTERSTVWLITGLVFAAVIAAVQGGVITETLTFQGDTRPSAFVINTDGRYHLSPTEALGFWEWEFLRDTGFTLLLLPFIIIAAWRSRKRTCLPVLIAGLALAHFSVPFVIGFPDRSHSMDRVIHAGMGLSALLIGYWLWQEFFQSQSSTRKKIARIVTTSMLLSTALHLPTRLLFPDLELEARSFLPQMPVQSDEEKQLYIWVREHSGTHDRFFFLPSSKATNIHDPDFSLFVAFTGRFVVKHGFNTDTVMGKDDSIRAIETSCREETLQELSVDYVIVRTDEQRVWFREQCRASIFRKVYTHGGTDVFALNVEPSFPSGNGATP